MLVTDEMIAESVLNHAARLRKGLSVQRNAGKLAKARQRAKFRIASTDNLVDRSRRAATDIVRKLVAGKMGKEYETLSSVQKMYVDNRVKERKVLLGSIAKKLFPGIRRAEHDRYKKAKVDLNK